MQTRTAGISRVLGWLLVVVFLHAPGAVLAQEKASEDTPADVARVSVTAIVGGDIHTVSGGVIRGGTVLVSEGKILEVGQNVVVPEGARVLDAYGRVVTPGFVAISMTGVGARATQAGSPGEGGGGDGGAATAATNKVADILDPFDRNIKYSLSVGITTGCVQLSASNRRGRRGRDGAPAEFFLGVDQDPDGVEAPEEEEHRPGEEFLDDEDSTCGCCGLTVLPTEPIVPARPAPSTPRRHAVLKMSYGQLDSMLVKEHAFYDLAPGALASSESRYQWRADIKRVRKSMAMSQEQPGRERESGERSRSSDGSRRPGTGGGRGRSSGGGSDADLLRLIKKEVSLRTQANTVDEIRDMIDLATELDYDLVLESVIEGWIVASELGQSKVPVILTPRSRRQPRTGLEDRSGSSIESSGIFEKAGVSFALAALSSSVNLNGIAGRDLLSLPLEAAFAVRGGASEEAALSSLTMVPARMLHLEDRIGSIEVGKDADLLILTGPPLDYRTYVETAMVGGRVSYEREKDGIYPPRGGSSR